MADTDVNGIENLLAVIYNANSSQKDRAYAQEILTKFQESPDSWISVPAIIENSRNQETKFFALQALDKVIEFRWKILPNEQRMGMRAYIVNKIVQLSSNEQIFRDNKILVQKLNQTLVQILKQEWPNSWGSFIEDIVTASQNNEVLCENNMNILKLLSEEIFDFSKNKMTLAKATNLKNEFKREFLLIYQLCEFSLKNAQKAELLQQTLRTILGFLNFIEQKYIFDTDLINFLVNKFLPNVKFRNGALRCLTEIVGLTKIDSNYQETLFAQLLNLVLQQLNSIVPPNIDLSAAYEKGSSSDKLFVNNLALFITVLFKNHARIFETDERYHPILIEAHKYLARITSVDEEEIFKICLEYWNGLAESLCHECYPKGGFFQVSAVSSSRKKLYSDPLQSVRISLISKMSKPEEVLIIEDENGEMIKEEFPDCNTIALYNMMRDTLVYLTHLDPNETIRIMKEKLTKISQNLYWTRQELNSLCWAIGSISGSQSEDEEKRILVQIIRELLTLSEKERTKDNKAIVASNIMYIVGQYPRFLNNHWRFLHTVIIKLFEFMKEDHPGIRDMACETFLKIAKACKQKFVITQPMASSPFIMNILDDLNQIIGPLEASQVAVFFEAVGYIIAAHNDLSVKRKLIFQLMAGANQKWDDVIQMASINLNILFDDVKTAKLITSILNLNLKASQSLGSWYLCQLERNFVTMMHIYRTFSTHISKIISLEGIQTKAPIRVFRAVKRETLRLLQNFIQNAKDFTFISQNVIPPLFDAILDDYLNSHSAARDPEVISLITITITQLKQNIVNEIPKIFFTVIQPTISMIQTNFEDFPDHRIYFFNLIQAINTHCFNAFFIIKPEQFKLAIDSIVWAFKHPIKNISDIGLLTLYQLWVNIQHSEIAPAFYQTFLLSLLNDLLTVLTDSFHKSGFKMQSGLLLLIISSVQSGKVTVPLWDTANINYANNQSFVGEYMVKLISSGLPNLSQGQVVSFVKGLFDHCNNLPEFKQHLRDFIVNMKEFADADNSELYREEQEAKEKEILSIKAAVPGLIKSTEALNLSL